MVLEGDKLRLQFDNIGGGLASRDGKPLNWFEIIGKESDWTKADAVIEGDSVVLSSDKVKAPAAMRFAWDKSAAPNLMNKEGLPASAFRSGKEPVIDILGLKVAESKDYELLYALDLAKASRDLVYDVDRRAQITRPIDRVAYFLELRNMERRRSGCMSRWTRSRPTWPSSASPSLPRKRGSRCRSPT